MNSEGKEITTFQKRCLLDFSNTARTSVAALGKEKEKWKSQCSMVFLSAHGSQSQQAHCCHLTAPLLTREQAFYWLHQWPLKRHKCRNGSKQSVCLENGSQEFLLLLLKIPSPPLLASHLPPPSLSYTPCISVAQPCQGSCQSFGLYLGTLATLEDGLGGGTWRLSEGSIAVKTS